MKYDIDTPRIKVFQRNIKLLMIDCDLSYDDLAERIGCTPAWLRKIVHKGVNRVTAKNEAWLKAIAREFNLSHPGDLWNVGTIWIGRPAFPWLKTTPPEPPSTRPDFDF